MCWLLPRVTSEANVLFFSFLKYSYVFQCTSQSIYWTGSRSVGHQTRIHYISFTNTHTINVALYIQNVYKSICILIYLYILEIVPSQQTHTHTSIGLNLSSKILCTCLTSLFNPPSNIPPPRRDQFAIEIKCTHNRTTAMQTWGERWRRRRKKKWPAFKSFILV